MGQAFIISGADTQTRVNQALKITGSIIKTEIKLPNADVLLLDEENSLGIDKVRQTKRFLQTKPFILNDKIVIIKSGQRLTIPAQNALLKTLEEPPGNNLIFLLTQSSEPLLSTVVSRCQLIHLPPTSHCPHPTAHIPLPTSHCQIPALFALAEKLAKDRQTALNWLDSAVSASRSLLLSKYLPKLGFNSLSNSDAITGSNLTVSQLTAIIHKLTKTSQLIQQNVNSRLALENLFLSL